MEFNGLQQLSLKESAISQTTADVFSWYLKCLPFWSTIYVKRSPIRDISYSRFFIALTLKLHRWLWNAETVALWCKIAGIQNKRAHPTFWADMNEGSNWHIWRFEQTDKLKVSYKSCIRAVVSTTTSFPIEIVEFSCCFISWVNCFVLLLLL